MKGHTILVRACRENACFWCRVWTWTDFSSHWSGTTNPAGKCLFGFCFTSSKHARTRIQPERLHCAWNVLRHFMSPMSTSDPPEQEVRASGFMLDTTYVQTHGKRSVTFGSYNFPWQRLRSYMWLRLALSLFETAFPSNFNNWSPKEILAFVRVTVVHTWTHWRHPSIFFVWKSVFSFCARIRDCSTTLAPFFRCSFSIDNWGCC